MKEKKKKKDIPSKLTKGQIQIQNAWRDLAVNPDFKRELSAIQELYFQDLTDHPDIEGFTEPTFREIFLFAKKYNLIMGDAIGIVVTGGINDLVREWSDVCTFNYDAGSIRQLKRNVAADEYEWLLTKYQKYPVSISISADASKNQVLDYINVNWDKIERLLREWKPKPRRTRTRPASDFDSIIADTMNLKAEAVVQRIKTKFPNRHGITEELVYTRRKLLKKRAQKR